MVYLKKKIQPRCRSTYRFFMGISHVYVHLYLPSSTGFRNKNFPMVGPPKQNPFVLEKNPRFPTTWLWAVSPLVCLGQRMVSWSLLNDRCVSEVKDTSTIPGHSIPGVLSNCDQKSTVTGSVLCFFPVFVGLCLSH